MTNFNRFCMRYGETAIFLLNVMCVIGTNKEHENIKSLMLFISFKLLLVPDPLSSLQIKQRNLTQLEIHNKFQVHQKIKREWEI